MPGGTLLAEVRKTYDGGETSSVWPGSPWSWVPISRRHCGMAFLLAPPISPTNCPSSLTYRTH